MYKKGDTVVYASHGVCRISDIECHDFSGADTEYYVLRPVFDSRSTVFVPLSNEELVSRMRRVHTKDELSDKICRVDECDSIWVQSEPERKRVFGEIISRGELDALICLLHTLYAHKASAEAAGKRLHLSDSRFLADAERMLADEVSFSMEITREEALNYISSAFCNK